MACIISWICENIRKWIDVGMTPVRIALFGCLIISLVIVAIIGIGCLLCKVTHES